MVYFKSDDNVYDWISTLKGNHGFRLEFISFSMKLFLILVLKNCLKKELIYLEISLVGFNCQLMKLILKQKPQIIFPLFLSKS